jgi:hypothetical protein
MARRIKPLKVDKGYSHRDHRSKKSRDLFHGGYHKKGNSRFPRIYLKKMLEKLKIIDLDDLT